MVAADSWLLESWNGTDRGDSLSDPVVGCLCTGWMSGWRGLSDLAVGCLDDEESWLDGWLSFASVDGVLFGSSVRVDYGRSVEPTSQMWDVRPVHVASLFLRVTNTKRKMFCITSVEFLMKFVKKCQRFSSQHSPLGPVGSVSSFDSFRSPCPSLNLGSPWVLVSVLFE